MLHKFNHTIFGRTVSILLAFAMLSSTIGNPVIAQDIPQTENQPRAYLVAVSLPEFGTLELPKFKDREEAQKYGGSLMRQRVHQTLAELRRLQEGGLIQGVELVNDGQSIRIQGVDEIAFPMIEKIGTVDAILDDTGEIGPCLTNAAEVFPERLWGLSQAQLAHSSTLDEIRLDVASPNVEIYYYKYDDTWWYIFGSATPKNEVKLEIWRNGSLVAYDYQFSDADGRVFFYPDYQACPSEHYSWQLASGDTVKIITAGQTSQTVYAPITAGGNPDTNMVFGTTLPGRTVEVTITQQNLSQPCVYDDFSKQGIADSQGNFAIDMASVVDFNQYSSWLLLASIDNIGNLTYTYEDIYYFNIYENSDFYYLSHEPNEEYTVTLKRSGTPINVQNGVTNNFGWASGNFTVDVLPGDIAIFSIGTDTFTRTVINYIYPEVTTFDPTTGILNGTGPVGQSVFVEVYNSSSVASATCGYYSRCLSTTVDGTGHFSFNLGPIYESERVYLSAIFQDGSTGGISVYSKPIIAAHPDSDYVNFDDYFSADPTVTLKTSGGAIKETVLAVRPYYYYWGYEANFSVDMISGDIIEITDGTRTETMVVGDLQDLRLNFNTNHLTGKGTGKRVIAEIGGYGGDSYYYCVENNLGSNTTFDFAIPTVNADYYASVDLIGSDGHFTHKYTSSLDLNVWVNYAYLSGNTETPEATVNWELWRGGGIIDSGSALDNPLSTYFYVWYNITPVAGDELRVTTSDGNTASIIYPTITVQADFGARTISGMAIAERPGTTNINRHTPDGYYSYNIYWYPYSGNNYLAHMPQEMYWGRDCSVVDASYPCGTVGAYTWTADNFWTVNQPSFPLSITVDAFEADDTRETASTVSGVQSHTLHTYNDEDWIKFTVTQEDVDHAHVFLFRTFDLGWDFDLTMELRAPDGTTKITEAGAENWDGSGLGPELQYIFAAPGTYYLRLHSMGSDWDGGYCDSKYSLQILIDPKWVFLPFIKR